jgi:hypothetical protein
MSSELAGVSAADDAASRRFSLASTGDRKTEPGMSAAVLAKLMGGLAAVLAVAALVLGWLNGVTAAGAFTSFLASSALSALTFGLVGSVIASRRPSHRIGWLFCLAGVGDGLQALAGQYAQYTLLTQPGLLPAGTIAAWANRWLFVVGLVLPVSYLLLLFPDGHLPARRWLPVAWFIGAAAFGYALVLAVNPDSVPGLPTVPNPVGVERLRGALTPALTTGGLLVAMGVLAGVASLVARFRRVDGEPREQIKWLAYAAAMLFMTLAARGVLSGLGFLPPDLLPLGRAAEAVALQGVPLAAGVAILRYRLYDMDRLINRTLVYGTLTAGLGLVYWGGVALLQSLVRPFTGGSDLAIVGSTLLVAGLFQPFRSRVQAIVDRRFYRRRYDVRQTLEAFSSRLRDDVDLESLSHELVGVVQHTMEPSGVSLWLRLPNGRRAR